MSAAIETIQLPEDHYEWCNIANVALSARMVAEDFETAAAIAARHQSTAENCVWSTECSYNRARANWALGNYVLGDTAWQAVADIESQAGHLPFTTNDFMRERIRSQAMQGLSIPTQQLDAYHECLPADRPIKRELADILGGYLLALEGDHTAAAKLFDTTLLQWRFESFRRPEWRTQLSLYALASHAALRDRPMARELAHHNLTHPSKRVREVARKINLSRGFVVAGAEALLRAPQRGSAQNITV